MKTTLTNYTKDYYEEYYFVAANHNKVLKRPYQKVNRFTTSLLITTIIFSLLVVLSWIVAYHDTYLKILNIILTVFAVALFGIIIFISSRFKHLVSLKPKNELEITADAIELKAPDGTIDHLSWDRVKYILVNKNSVIFVPVSKGFPIIGAPADYKDKIIAEVTKLDHIELIREKN